MSGPTVDRRFVGAAQVMAGGVLLAKLSGFVRDATIAALHGAGPATDAYFAAFCLPDLLNYMLSGGALSVAFLPIFTRAMTQDGEAAAWRVFSTVLTTLMGVMMVFVVVCVVAAPSLLPWLVPGFSPDTMDHAVRLTRIVLPGQVAFLAAGVVTATLYARESFWAPALAPLVYNVGILAGGLLWGPGIDGFAWGVLLGAFGGVLGLPVIAARKTLRWSPRIDLRDRDFVDFMKLSLPLMLGFSLLTVDEWFGRWLGSAWTGTLTHLNNARRIMLVPTAVLGQATAMASLPFLTRLHAEGRAGERDRVLGVALAKVAAVTVVAGLGLVALAPAAVVLVFGRGAYGPEDVRVTAELLEVYAFAVPAWGLQAVAVRAFYAARDTLTPMILATVITAAMAPVYGALAHEWGPVGIPAAGALGMWVNAAATLLALRRRGIRPSLSVAAIDGAKALGAATLVGAAVLWGRQAAGDWGWTPLGALVVGGVGGLAFAGLILHFLRRGGHAG